jgi:hypothetical protein
VTRGSTALSIFIELTVTRGSTALTIFIELTVTRGSTALSIFIELTVTRGSTALSIFIELTVTRGSIALSIFIELTVTRGSTARTECNAAFALQQWLCKSATVLHYTTLSALLLNVGETQGLYYWSDKWRAAGNGIF